MSKLLCIMLLGIHASLITCCTARHSAKGIKKGIVGTWTHTRTLEKKKPETLTGHVMNVVDKMAIPSPYPEKLIFFADGTYEATYSGKQLDGIRRRRGSQDLEATQVGKYRVFVDWSGLSWIEMNNGVPERRITLGGNKLTLHKARDGWTAEKFVRLK